MTNSALDTQVGGDHYKKLGMQPVVFATLNRYDPSAYSILKYVTRWRDKDGLRDLHKARHFVELRMTEDVSNGLPIYPATGPDFNTFSVTTYCSMNNLDTTEAQILHWLQNWVHYSRLSDTDKSAPDAIIFLIDQLISDNGGR